MTGELSWLAGIVEGEGHIRNTNQSKRPHWRGTNLTIAMTDADVISSVQQIVGAGNVRVERRPNRKAMYVWGVSGDTARWLLGMLYPLLHGRRQSQIEEAV